MYKSSSIGSTCNVTWSSYNSNYFCSKVFRAFNRRSRCFKLIISTNSFTKLFCKTNMNKFSVCITIRVSKFYLSSNSWMITRTVSFIIILLFDKNVVAISYSSNSCSISINTKLCKTYSSSSVRADSSYLVYSIG